MINQIKYLYPNADPQMDFELQDNSDGNGPYISKWNTTKLGVQPTPAQLLAVKAVADLTPAKATKLAALDAERKRLETLPITGNQGGKTFNISRPEKINEFLMGGLSIALDPSPAATFTMLDDNGVEVTYSKTLMGQIINFMNTAKQPALARYAARKAAIEAASSTAAVDAVEVDLSKP